MTETEAKSQLEKLGVTLPDKGKRPDMFANLDEATKAKAEKIMDQLKAGKLTETEAKSQLAKLGVTLPGKGERLDMFANLDAATKAKAQSIMDDMKTQLDELGVKGPARG